MSREPPPRSIAAAIARATTAPIWSGPVPIASAMRSATASPHATPKTSSAALLPDREAERDDSRYGREEWLLVPEHRRRDEPGHRRGHRRLNDGPRPTPEPTERHLQPLAQGPHAAVYPRLRQYAQAHRPVTPLRKKRFS